MKRIQISSGAKWEAEVGYSRAIRAGNLVEVAGTVAAGEGGVQHPGDPYRQTAYILKKIKKSLESVGATLNDVVRTRMYVTAIGDWEEIGRAHGEYFRDIRPVTTMVEVSRLIDPDYLVEIEATAVVDH